MSNVSRGQSKELLCRKVLEKEGWKIVFKSIRWKFGTIDFAKLFDVVALKDKQWKFISVKNYATFKNLPKHQKEILDFKNTCGLEGMEFEIWFWKQPHWRGRYPNKVWEKAQWVKKVIQNE